MWIRALTTRYLLLRVNVCIHIIFLHFLKRVVPLQLANVNQYNFHVNFHNFPQHCEIHFRNTSCFFVFRTKKAAHKQVDEIDGWND